MPFVFVHFTRRLRFCYIQNGVNMLCYALGCSVGEIAKHLFR